MPLLDSPLLGQSKKRVVGLDAGTVGSGNMLKSGIVWTKELEERGRGGSRFFSEWARPQGHYTS